MTKTMMQELGNNEFLAKGVKSAHKAEDTTGAADNIALTTKLQL